MFTLAIFCLTTTNLPWFKDLTFQVHMQYGSLQHQTLLPSPVTSTIGCYFCFGSVFSFFLELVLHRSPAAYWAPTNLGSSSFSVLPIFVPFHAVHGVLKARIRFAIPFSSGLRFVRTLHHDPSVLGGPTQHGSVSMSQIRLWSMWTVWLVFWDCGFYSVCPLMEEDKRLPDGRDWLKGILGLVLMGRAMLSKSSIQFSVDGLIWKDPDAEKDWRREEKGMTEDEIVGWNHSLKGHEFE